MEACGAREVELDNEINSPEVYNDPDLLRQKSDELSDLRFHQEGSCLPREENAMEEQEKPTSRASRPKNKGGYSMPKNRRNYQKTRRIALSGLLFALAMALSFIEGTLVIPGLLPGMKLGLANIVVMYALFFMGPKQALVLDVLKALFVFLVSGFTAGFLSLCGGLFCPAVMGCCTIFCRCGPPGSSCRYAAHWPQHRPAAGCGVIISSSLVAVLCAGHAGAGACHGRAHLHHPRALLPALGKWASIHQENRPD